MLTRAVRKPHGKLDVRPKRAFRLPAVNAGTPFFVRWPHEPQGRRITGQTVDASGGTYLGPIAPGQAA